jgi:hypothetical protein
MVQISGSKKAMQALAIAQAHNAGDYSESFIELLNHVINPINASPSMSAARPFTIEEEGPDSNTFKVCGESWKFRIVKHADLWYAIEA